MLSRTADHLFWLARYTERADNTARMLDLNVQADLLPDLDAGAHSTWRASLGLSELDAAFRARHGEYTAAAVIDFMVRDLENPASIASCLRGARENARAVRGVLTTEVWETQNTTWLELQRQLADGLHERDPAQFFEWVKFRSHLSRGTTVGTMLRDEAVHFMRLGTFLERADNTARLLDVKFIAAPGSADVAGDDSHREFYYWAAVLKAVSGFEIYRKVFRDVITPERVASLLILREDMPRSLAACLAEVVANLAAVRNARSGETERRAGRLQAELRFGRMEDIFAVGLHRYLTGFLEAVYDLGNRVSNDFLVPVRTG